MATKKKKPIYVFIINAFFAFLFVFAAVFLFYYSENLEALTGGVEFSDDVSLGLAGLEEETYIESGAKASSVELGVNTLDVLGAPAGEFFTIRTDSHKVFEILPEQESGSFSLSTNNINPFGYLSAWDTLSSGKINYGLGVEEESEVYFVQKDGENIEGSPFSPDAQQEISFSNTGEGHYSFLSEGAGIEFTDDVILDLAGLQVTVYIAQGSRAGYLEVGESTLNVYGVPSGGFFKLKTDSHTVLNVQPTGGTADFSISSSDIDSLGYIREWYGDSSDITNFTLGTPQANFYYTVLRNGSEIEGSPFLSSSEEEVSFGALGVGTYNIGISHGAGDAYLRGWAWSDNIGWICFSSQDDPETEVAYGVNIEEGGILSGYAWSDNIGWITFNEEDLGDCPEGDCIAKIESNELVGWGKVLSNDEWVSLAGNVNGESYGPSLIGDDFHGWAWGDKTLGWISFNCQNENECEEKDYKVWVSGLQMVSPTVRTNPATNIDPAGTAVLNGTLLDMGGYEETLVWFEWGTDTSLGESTTKETATEITSFYEEISVELGETYYFRAAAENEEGKFYGNVLNFSVTERSGQIIIEYGDFYRGIDILKEGLIETVE